MHCLKSQTHAKNREDIASVVCRFGQLQEIGCRVKERMTIPKITRSTLCFDDQNIILREVITNNSNMQAYRQNQAIDGIKSSFNFLPRGIIPGIFWGQPLILNLSGYLIDHPLRFIQYPLLFSPNWHHPPSCRFHPWHQGTRDGLTFFMMLMLVRLGQNSNQGRHCHVVLLFQTMGDVFLPATRSTDRRWCPQQHGTENCHCRSG